MSRRKKFEAALFDLDGVITDTAEFHYRAWKRLADALGIPFDRRINERLKGVDRMASLEIILERATSPYADAEKHDLAASKNRFYRELISGMTPANLLPGALDALETAKHLGLKVGLASSSKNACFILNKLEIAGRFDSIGNAEELRNAKPDPEIFLTVAADLSVAPDRCIGIEDAVAGIAAIKSAGMYAVGIGDEEVLTEADDVVPSIAALSLQKYL